MYWVFKSLLRRQQKLQNRQFMIMVVTRFINIEVFLFFTDCFAYSDMRRCCFFNSKITCCGCFPYSKSIICSAINASPFKSAGKRRENQTERLKRSKRDSWQKNLFHKHCCMLQMKSYISMITIIWWPADVYQLSQGFWDGFKGC